MRIDEIGDIHYEIDDNIVYQNAFGFGTSIGIITAMYDKGRLFEVNNRYMVNNYEILYLNLQERRKLS